MKDKDITHLYDAVAFAMAVFAIAALLLLMPPLEQDTPALPPVPHSNENH